MPVINSLKNNNIHRKNIGILADGWVKVLDKYENKCKYLDSIHWYNERTNVGALAAAGWLNKGIAMEEYSSTKTEDEKHGRVDLYLQIKKLVAVCEAKMVSVSISKQAQWLTARKNIKNSINEALKDCKKTFDGKNCS